jgi:hypothetical protein
MRRLPASMRYFHRSESARGIPSIIKMCGGADMSDKNIDLSNKNHGDAVVSKILCIFRVRDYTQSSV